MLEHPLYAQARDSLTEYEADLEKRMRAQLGAEWWVRFAHPQTVRDYLTAYDDMRRLSAMRTMLRDALMVAHNIRQAD